MDECMVMAGKSSSSTLMNSTVRDMHNLPTTLDNQNAWWSVSMSV